MIKTYILQYEVGIFFPESISYIISYQILLGGYAVISVESNNLASLLAETGVLYIEEPVYLIYENPLNQFTIPQQITYEQIRSTSCFSERYSGQNILIGAIDSGADIYHSAFQTVNRKTRFLAYYDLAQNIAYNEEDLNSLLENPERNEFDQSGHGTAVLGIAAALAPNAGLIMAALPSPPNTLPQTDQLMLAVDRCVRFALSQNLPLVLNISYGTTFGDHTGNTLWENYLNTVSSIGKFIFVSGTGNEGTGFGHKGGDFSDTPIAIPFTVDVNQSPFTLDCWFFYAQEAVIRLQEPGGQPSQNTPLIIGPAPYTTIIGYQYLLAGEPYVKPGNWQLYITGIGTTKSAYHCYLPPAQTLNQFTRFVIPDQDITLTLPSTANRILSIGSYNSQTFILSPFSGKGYTFLNQIKPDLVAPGEGIPAPVAGTQQFSSFTGTSFSAPIAAAACACLMEWGITLNNDPFLYGEKLKALLLRQAKALPAYHTYPNLYCGYGALCANHEI